MIKIDFITAISILTSCVLLLVFIPWITYNYTRTKNRSNDNQHLIHCPFCSYIFFDYQNREVNSCPRCQSLIEKKDGEDEHAEQNI